MTTTAALASGAVLDFQRAVEGVQSATPMT